MVTTIINTDKTKHPIRVCIASMDIILPYNTSRYQRSAWTISFKTIRMEHKCKCTCIQTVTCILIMFSMNCIMIHNHTNTHAEYCNTIYYLLFLSQPLEQ